VVNDHIVNDRMGAVLARADAYADTLS
jgi:hypothetical protein